MYNPIVAGLRVVRYDSSSLPGLSHEVIRQSVVEGHIWCAVSVAASVLFFGEGTVSFCGSCYSTTHRLVVHVVVGF